MSILKSNVRKGCKDIWNAWMVKDAKFIKGMPLSKSTDKIPTNIISYEEAMIIYRENLKKGKKAFKIHAYIHFYIDDYKFDNPSGIWIKPKNFVKLLSHFDGCIAPDFSTYADFPEPIRKINYYRMYTYAYWLTNSGYNCIHNVRWNADSLDYCFAGIAEGSTISIGTVASKLNNPVNRMNFEIGLYEVVDIIKPKAIIIYGYSNLSILNSLKARGIKIITFKSTMNKFFGGDKNE